MDIILISIVLLIVLTTLLVTGVWIGVSLAIVGAVTFVFFSSADTFSALPISMWGALDSWELAALPLFIWMGEILFRTKLSDQMFEGLSPWVERLPGGLLHVNVIACGLFGSVCGSTAATTATVAKAAIPELKRRGYDEKLCLGSLCGSGTLGILIPPSVTMIIYAVAAQVPIIELFAAGLMPALLIMILFMAYIILKCLSNPELAPKPVTYSNWTMKFRALYQLIPVTVLIVFVIWVIFAGYATATEAAAFGAIGSLVLAFIGGNLSWHNFRVSLLGATKVSVMIMFILAGAAFLSKAMAYTGIPRGLAEWVSVQQLAPWALISTLTIIYLVLGTALDGTSMIVLTSSVVIPMIQAAGIDLVWFGIFIILMVELSEITPPVGFNLFILQAMTGRDSTYVAWASIPFFLLLTISVVAITVFPEIVLWLPKVLVR